MVRTMEKGEVAEGCGTQLSGGWTQRTREVIDLPPVPAQVTEHVYITRVCPVCEQRRRLQPTWRVWRWGSSGWGSICSA